MWGKLKWVESNSSRMGADDERVAVKTYVPRYQKERWSAHADAMNMSQSEFVRTMVQAGRREFEVPELLAADSHDSDTTDSNSTTPDRPAGSSSESSFPDRILTVLDHHGPLDWDDLVSVLVEDIEDELDDALDTLQADNRIRYSGRDGGYVVMSND